MKTLGMYVALFILLSFGISIGGLLWEGEDVPLWMLSLFLIPVVFLLDYFSKGKIYPSIIRKYSTTIGILCIFLTGYLLLDSQGLGSEFGYAIFGFLLLLVFLPEILIIAGFWGS